MDAITAKKCADNVNDKAYEEEYNKVIAAITAQVSAGLYSVDLSLSLSSYVLHKLIKQGYRVEKMGDRYVVQWNKVKEDKIENPRDKYAKPWGEPDIMPRYPPHYKDDCFGGGPAGPM